MKWKFPLIVPLALVALLGACTSSTPPEDTTASAIPTLDAPLPIPAAPAEYGFETHGPTGFLTKVPISPEDARAFLAFYESSMTELGWKRTDSLEESFHYGIQGSTLVTTWARDGGRASLVLVWGRFRHQVPKTGGSFSYTLCPPNPDAQCLIPGWLSPDPPVSDQ